MIALISKLVIPCLKKKENFYYYWYHNFHFDKIIFLCFGAITFFLGINQKVFFLFGLQLFTLKLNIVPLSKNKFREVVSVDFLYLCYLIQTIFS